MMNFLQRRTSILFQFNAFISQIENNYLLSLEYFRRIRNNMRVNWCTGHRWLQLRLIRWRGLSLAADTGRVINSDDRIGSVWLDFLQVRPHTHRVFTLQRVLIAANLGGIWAVVKRARLRVSNDAGDICRGGRVALRVAAVITGRPIANDSTKWQRRWLAKSRRHTTHHLHYVSTSFNTACITRTET